MTSVDTELDSPKTKKISTTDNAGAGKERDTPVMITAEEENELQNIQPSANNPESTELEIKDQVGLEDEEEKKKSGGMCSGISCSCFGSKKDKKTQRKSKLDSTAKDDLERNTVEGKTLAQKFVMYSRWYSKFILGILVLVSLILLYLCYLEDLDQEYWQAVKYFSACGFVLTFAVLFRFLATETFYSDAVTITFQIITAFAVAFVFGVMFQYMVYSYHIGVRNTSTVINYHNVEIPGDMVFVLHLGVSIFGGTKANASDEDYVMPSKDTKPFYEDLSNTGTNENELWMAWIIGDEDPKDMLAEEYTIKTVVPGHYHEYNDQNTQVTDNWYTIAYEVTIKNAALQKGDNCKPDTRGCLFKALVELPLRDTLDVTTYWAKGMLELRVIEVGTLTEAQRADEGTLMDQPATVTYTGMNGQHYSVLKYAVERLSTVDIKGNESKSWLVDQQAQETQFHAYTPAVYENKPELKYPRGGVLSTFLSCTFTLQARQLNPTKIQKTSTEEKSLFGLNQALTSIVAFATTIMGLYSLVFSTGLTRSYFIFNKTPPAYVFHEKSEDDKKIHKSETELTEIKKDQ